MKKVIYCCGCGENVVAAKVTGLDVYPHRPDLKKLVFYRCEVCKNFVGTHRAGGKPLGVIATGAIKRERMKIHALLDPLWREGLIKRKEVYKQMSCKMGQPYHTAAICSLAECALVLEKAQQLSKQVRGI